VIGHDYFDRFIDPTCFIKAHFYDSIQNGEIFQHAENEILTRRGERRMIAWDNTVLRDSEGRVVGTASIGRDVTERYRAEQELRESEERLRLALSASQTGIWEADLSKGTVTWSDECYSIFGIPHEDFNGQVVTFWNAIHPDDVETVRKNFLSFITDQKAYMQEYRIVRPDGEIRWVSNLGAILDDTRHPKRVTGTVVDITARKQTEEALRKAERFAAAGRMAATVAHEINNPLASLVNVLYLLQSEVTLDSSKELLRIAGTELNRVVRISRQTLGFYQSSKVSSDIDIVDLVGDVKASFESIAAKRGISLGLDIRGGLPTLHGFGDEIRQVLINALTNACESGATKVTVRVRTAQHWRVSRRTGVRILVVDDGKGIERENLRKLFEPFFTTKGEKGTGLGLWVSRGIVLKHEGDIRLRSSTREGYSGTCLWIHLPARLGRPRSVSAEN
jgi:PAS domain S-box-containing protein